MKTNIVKAINSWHDWYTFADKVKNSETYKHSWFVYSDCFNELPAGAKCQDEICLGKNLTESEAKRIYDANKYAVENCGTDYAEIYMANLYEPYGGSEPFVYERATGEKPTRAYELREIANSVFAKFKKLGLL